jgi:ADP-ribose pyrophosphatase YjhB (NUDIX family)
MLPNGEVVLIQRRDSGLWGLPGGLMDWGEDIATTANRELMEETGLEITHIGRLVGVYSSPERDPRFHSVCVVLEAQVSGIPKIQDPVEVIAVSAFAKEDIDNLQLAHDHTHHIRDYLANKTVVD